MRASSSHLRPRRSNRVAVVAASAASLSYGGRCARCGGAHALPASPAALEAARTLRQSLERHRCLDFDSSTGSSSGPSSSSPYSTLPFLPRSQGGNGGPGRMLGVLVCADGTVLRAFSGQLALSPSSTGEGGGGWSCPGWSGPVAGITNDSREYGRFRALSDALTRRIGAADGGGGGGGEEGERRRRLRARRRGLSHALIARVQESYVTRDLVGRPVALREAYLALAEATAADEASLPITRLSPGCGGGHNSNNTWLGFPTGTGDCCAPKLLHEAALKGLEPVALAEFWFGAPSSLGRDDGGSVGSDGSDGSADEALPPPSSSGSDEQNSGSSTGADYDHAESKEEAWRRRQRQRVLKAGRRRAAMAATTGAEGAAPPPRAHGEYFGPCFKCAGILGTMLCSCGAVE